MVRLVVVLLTYALAVRGDGVNRYGDYSAAGMPHYNVEYENRAPAPMDEYPDRSPDAPAHLDYKYEEESHDTVKAFPVKHMDDEIWQKPNVKRKGLNKMTHIDEGKLDVLVPKYESKRRFVNHRNRVKYDKVERPSGRQLVNYARSRNSDIGDLDDRNDFEVNKRPSHDYSIDSDKFSIRDTTLRVPRRKPRDRTISQERITRYENDNEEEISNIRRIDDDTEDMESTIDRHRQKPNEIIQPPISVKNKQNAKAYPDYEQYEDHDMKRINRLKNRLPELFRRTKASDPEPASTRRMQEFTHRRTFPPDEAATTSPSSLLNKIKLVTNGTRTTASVETSVKVINTNLSLAEKSRLSILKKAQRKESSKNTTTTKPPVLLQVTKQLQTVVMVEHNNPEIHQRSRLVFHESPERIERAKNLMRRKLVAGARNIHELTDNWDEMVCDYIDVSLLDNKANALCYSNIILISVIFNTVMALRC